MQRYYYLCKSWQGFLQQIVAQLSFGYEYYHLVTYPEKKKDKWTKIDEKLIKKYQTKKSRFQRSRLKSKGISNFYFIRWQNTAIILHSKGEIPDEINYDDAFLDINKTPLLLKISERITFKVQKNPSNRNKLSAFLERNSYLNIKHTLYDIARKKNKHAVIKQFKKINGLPNYAGIHQQKTNLRDALIKHCQKHDVKINKKELFIRTKRNIVEVYDKTHYLF